MPSSVAGLLATALLQIYLMLVTFSFVPFLHLPVSRQSALAGFAAVSLTSWVLVRWRPARWLLPLIAGAAFIVLSYRWPQLWWGLYLLRRQLRWLAVQAAGGAVTQMPPLAGTFLLAAGALAGTALAYAWVARGRPRSVVFLGSMAFLFQWLFYFDEADRWFWLTAPVGFTWLALEEGRRLALAAGAHPTAPHRLAYLGATAGSLLLAAGVARALPADLPAAPLGGVGASLSRALPLLATLRGASGVLPLPPGPFTLATTGFTNSDLELGGTVQPNDGVALRVRVRGTDVPDVLYLRGAARDVYTGRGWTQSDPTVLRLQEPRLSRYLPPPGAELVTLEVEVTGLTTTSVFHLLAPAYLRAPFAESYLDQLGNLTAPTPLPPGTRYTVTSWLPETASRVDRQGTSPTADPPPALPGGVEPPARVRDLARKVAGRARTPLEKARAVEAYLRAIPYSLDCPVTPPGRDFVDYFLFDLQKGYCTYYSTAMATMLRSLGIPTRWVTGFRVDL
ncbi:MAG: hypothetical protein IRY95_08110, partial [Clostridia bacterium]|nr:hypothetical protein [Clostridia bacterium]